MLARIGSLELAEVGSVTASAGVAGFPHQAFDRDELIRLAFRAPTERPAPTGGEA